MKRELGRTAQFLCLLALLIVEDKFLEVLLLNLVLHLLCTSVHGKSRLRRDGKLAHLRIQRSLSVYPPEVHPTYLGFVSLLREQRELHHACRSIAVGLFGLGDIFAVIATLLAYDRSRYGLFPEGQRCFLVYFPIVCIVGDHLGELFFEIGVIVFRGADVLGCTARLEQDGLWRRRTFVYRRLRSAFAVLLVFDIASLFILVVLVAAVVTSSGN